MKDWRKVWNLVWPTLSLAKGRLLLMVGIIVITAFSQVYEPVIYGGIVDTIVTSLSDGTQDTLLASIVPQLLIWIGLFVVTTVLSTVLLYLGWKVASATSKAFSQRVAGQIMYWSHERSNTIATGRLVKLFDDAWRGAWTAVDSLFLQVFPTSMTFLVVIGVGFTIDWRMTLAALALLPVAVGLGIYSFKKASPRQDAIKKLNADAHRIMNENIASHTEIRNYAQEKRRLRMFARILNETLHKQVRLNVFWAIFHGAGGGMQLFSRVIVFVVGVMLVANGATTLGTLITFLGLLTFILTPVQYLIANAMPRFSEAFTSFKLIALELEKHNGVEEKKRAKKLTRLDGRLELAQVSFQYRDQKRKTLKNVSLTIPDGSSCALVGPSGAGKSTLAKLLNRTIDPTQGTVLLDGFDIRDYTLSSLRSKIGVVSQDPVLFNETIAANLRFVKPRATQKEIEAACKKAEAHSFIKRLPKGYKSLVGDRGVKLSGGERQRIALARIFLADTPILILDESTSALDSETERKLQDTLTKVMKGRTTLLIAHRLSTIYLADQIVVMKDGRVIDTGTHEELVKNGGLYKKLWNLQAGGYLK